MITRKKRLIDGMDKEILRVLYNNGNHRTASGAIIAKAVNLTPPAIKPRLVNLHSHGIIKPLETGGIRRFTRVIDGDTIKVQSPSKIIWGLDLKKRR